MSDELPQIYAERGADQLISTRIGAVTRRYFPSVAVFLLVIAAWQVLMGVLFPTSFFAAMLPSPSSIARTFADRYDLLIRGAIYYTFKEAVVGFLVGCSLGVAVAVVSSRWKFLADGLVPYAVATNSIPIIAFAPLAIVWFGIGWKSKAVIVAIMTFFPTMVNTFKGLTTCDPWSLELMRSYAASELTIFRKVRLPTALPYLFSALKVCTTLSTIGAVVGEFFGGPVKALGVLIKSEASLFHMREAWAAIVVACVLGIIFYTIIVFIERLVMPWHVSFRDNR